MMVFMLASEGPELNAARMFLFTLETSPSPEMEPASIWPKFLPRLSARA